MQKPGNGQFPGRGSKQERKERHHAVAGAAHDHTGKAYAGKDGGQGILHAHIEERRNQRAGPRARTG